MAVVESSKKMLSCEWKYQDPSEDWIFSNYFTIISNTGNLQENAESKSTKFSAFGLTI